MHSTFLKTLANSYKPHYGKTCMQSVMRVVHASNRKQKEAWAKLQRAGPLSSIERMMTPSAAYHHDITEEMAPLPHKDKFLVCSPDFYSAHSFRDDLNRLWTHSETKQTNLSGWVKLRTGPFMPNKTVLYPLAVFKKKKRWEAVRLLSPLLPMNIYEVYWMPSVYMAK